MNPSIPESVPANPAFSNGIGKGWFLIVERLHEAMLRVDPNYTVDQVKEKFGGLRYYWEPSGELGTPESEIMAALVGFAESLSFRTCETCGRRGESRDTLGWIVTLCDGCLGDQIAGRSSNLSNSQTNSGGGTYRSGPPSIH